MNLRVRWELPLRLVQLCAAQSSGSRLLPLPSTSRVSFVLKSPSVPTACCMTLFRLADPLCGSYDYETNPCGDGKGPASASVSCSAGDGCTDAICCIAGRFCGITNWCYRRYSDKISVRPELVPVGFRLHAPREPPDPRGLSVLVRRVSKNKEVGTAAPVHVPRV